MDSKNSGRQVVSTEDLTMWKITLELYQKDVLGVCDI